MESSFTNGGQKSFCLQSGIGCSANDKEYVIFDKPGPTTNNIYSGLTFTE